MCAPRLIAFAAALWWAGPASPAGERLLIGAAASLRPALSKLVPALERRLSL